MKQLPPQHWQYNGQTFTVSLIVEGSTVVRMTPVTTTGGVIVPPTEYPDDHIANSLSKLGFKTCPTHTQHKERSNGVGMTPVTAAGGIIVPPKKYLGDHMGAAIGRVTGREPCAGCRKVEDGVSAMHRGAERIGQRVKKLVLNGAHKSFGQMTSRASKIRPGNPWHNGHQKSSGDG